MLEDELPAGQPTDEELEQARSWAADNPDMLGDPEHDDNAPRIGRYVEDVEPTTALHDWPLDTEPDRLATTGGDGQ